MNNQQDKYYFRERQHFTQWWLWLVVLGIAGLQWWAFIVQILLGHPFGDNPAPDAMLIAFWVLFGIGLPWLFVLARLETEVQAGGICVRLSPFHLRHKLIPWTDITAHAARRYNPLLEYGGWGIRYGKDGQAYNIRGNMGVRLELASGKHLLIGSQRAEELAQAISAAMEANKA